MTSMTSAHHLTGWTCSMIVLGAVLCSGAAAAAAGTQPQGPGAAAAPLAPMLGGDKQSPKGSKKASSPRSSQKARSAKSSQKSKSPSRKSRKASSPKRGKASRPKGGSKPGRKATTPKRGHQPSRKATTPKRGRQPSRKATTPNRGRQPSRKATTPNRGRQPSRKATTPNRGRQPSRKATTPNRGRQPSRKATTPRRGNDQRFRSNDSGRRDQPRTRQRTRRPDHSLKPSRRGPTNTERFRFGKDRTPGKPGRVVPAIPGGSKASPRPSVTKKRPAPINRFPRGKTPGAGTKNPGNPSGLDRVQPSWGDHLTDRFRGPSPNFTTPHPWAGEGGAIPPLDDPGGDIFDEDGPWDDPDGGHDWPHDDHHGHHGHHGHHDHFSLLFDSLWFGWSWSHGHHGLHFSYYWPLYYDSSYPWYAYGYGDPDWWYSYYGAPSYPYGGGGGYPIYETPLPSLEEAWALLGDGSIEAAGAMFSDLVYALPYDAEARIGHAISAGLLNLNTAAVADMRRAVRGRPEALGEVPKDAPLREQIYRLLDRYSNRVREDFGDTDGLFMVAALRFMLDDPSAAYFAVDAAIRSGDRDDSARYLKALLEELLFERF